LNFVENIFVKKFDIAETDKIKDFCLFFSDFYNIVKSNQFLNLKPEDGFDGGRTSVLCVDVDGLKKKVSVDEYQTKYKGGVELVALQSKEGQRRLGFNKLHANTNTVRVLEVSTNKFVRVDRKLVDGIKYINSPNKPSTKRTNVISIVENGSIRRITKAEYDPKLHIVAQSDIGRGLLGKDKIPSKRVGLVSCVDRDGKTTSISKIDYQNQKIIFGEDRNSWDYVHHTHPVGKHRLLG
jgi:hypothetical protein